MKTSKTLFNIFFWLWIIPGILLSGYSIVYFRDFTHFTNEYRYFDVAIVFFVVVPSIMVFISSIVAVFYFVTKRSIKNGIAMVNIFPIIVLIYYVIKGVTILEGLLLAFICIFSFNLHLCISFLLKKSASL
ncbi:hypothetical protein AS29_006875 [Bacillus sp. SJS]|nr:hypothetical protein AS29_006875 [Bacillus sp. SJS]